MSITFESHYLVWFFRRWRFAILAFGALLLAFGGYVLFRFSTVQAAGNVRIDPPARSAAVLNDDLIGRITVPRIDLSVIVIEGSPQADLKLRRAVAHIPGTALPGHPGNIGISGARDAFLLPLSKIKLDDIVSVATPRADFRYRVVSTKIVRPEEAEVLAATQAEVLTLITSYPFHFIGSAPNRFIVRAERLP